MKRPDNRLLALSAISMLALASLGGCPVDNAGTGLQPVEAGTYWVEYQDDSLMAFELPAYRGESGMWRTLETTHPEWFSGPALYELRADGAWDRVTKDNSESLDDVLQTYDPGPRLTLPGC